MCNIKQYNIIIINFNYVFIFIALCNIFTRISGIITEDFCVTH